MRNELVLGLALFLAMPSLASGKEPVPDNRYDDGVTLTITTRPFNPKGHAIEMCGEAVCAIDGKVVYGTYGRVPKQEVTSLIFEKNGKKIPLDVSAMYDPNVNNSNIMRYVKLTSWGQDTYEVTGYFSHDDGDDDMYICQWLIIQGKGSLRNYIGNYESLVGLATRVQKDIGP